MGQRWGEIAANTLAGCVFDSLDRVLDNRTLLCFIHAVSVACIVDAVRKELPLAVIAGLNDFGVVLA